MKHFLALCAAGLSAGLLAASPVEAAARDQLTIGVAQFPSTLHPNIDAEVIKAYALGFAMRQITAYDASWKNSCLICAELPTIENGLAKVEDRADGKKGMAVTIKLKPDLKWGDGEKVTAKDFAFTWKLARDPTDGLLQHPSLDAGRQGRCGRRPRPPSCISTRCFRPTTNGTRSCRSTSKGPSTKRRRRSGDYIKETAYARSPHDARALRRALHRHRLHLRRPDRHGTEPLLGGHQARLQAHRPEADREHGGAAGQSALRRRGHGRRRRRRPHHRSGARAAKAAPGPVHLYLQAEPDLRAYRFEGRQPDPRGCARAPGALSRPRIARRSSTSCSMACSRSPTPGSTR